LTVLPRKLVEAITLLICFRQVTGLNLVGETALTEIYLGFPQSVYADGHSSCGGQTNQYTIMGSTRTGYLLHVSSSLRAIIKEYQ